LGVLHAFDVLLRDTGRPLLRKPDVVVAPSRLFGDDVARFDAADVALVVEVLSEESEDVDLRVKLREYAVAEIANYWVVALDEPVSPVPLTVDLDALTRRRLME
jgi:Uma2 family endonuclease